MIPGRSHIIGRMTVMDAFRAVGSSGEPSMTQVIWYYDLPEVGPYQFVESISRATGSPPGDIGRPDGEHGDCCRFGIDMAAMRPGEDGRGRRKKREIR